MNMDAAAFSRPADKAVPAADMPGGRRPGQTAYRPLTGENDVFQMLAHRLAVTQIVIGVDQRVV